jgi:protein-tyrosine phosphatase
LDSFSIVFVCTGNRFRSPLAEAFVRRLTVGLPVTTQSLGTLDLEDAAALPEAIEIARSCGIDLSSHRTRYVGDASLTGDDLILGFDESHVRQAVVDAAAPREHAFAIKHFARLLPAVAPVQEPDVVARARNRVEQATALREVQPARGTSDSMRDPLGSSWKVYKQTAADVRALSLELAAALFDVSNSAALPPVPRRLRRPSSLRRR